ncbi:pyridoxal phosphate-dependent decarboxylase family protein, partial [Bacteroidota bacterium]
MNKKIIFPAKGLSSEQLLIEVNHLKENDVKWESGKLYGFVYHPGDEVAEVIAKVFHKFSHDNTISPVTFASLRKFEVEIVAMAADLLHGNQDVVGNVTSGGTESILMAVKTARDINREKHPEIKTPELIISNSAHPAFLKACHYLDVKPVIVPVREDKRADINRIEEATNSNTILIGCSAPTYPHGVIDPIEEIGKLAIKKNILLHVDACMGGFVLPFMNELGYPTPDFDFRIPGVTSISLDAHKYGYGPKGTSIILYRNKDLRKKQFYIYPDWPGGVFASPALSGTRGGGALAGTWAVMRLLGWEGYKKIVKSVIEESRKIINGISKIPGLDIISNPDMSVFSFTSNDADIFNIGDVMEEKGWYLNRQQFPNSLHMTISNGNVGKADEFLTDLENTLKNRKHLRKEMKSSSFKVSVVKRLSKLLPPKFFEKIISESTAKSIS